MRILTIIIILLSSSVSMIGQKNQKLNFPFENLNNIVIANITGDVTVKKKSNLDKITLETQFDQSIREPITSIRSMTRNDSLIIYVDHPCARLQLTEPKEYKGWFSGVYLWSDNCKSSEEKINFTLTIPEGLAVSAWTINQGDIEIHDVIEKLYCKNVNGDISLSGVKEVVKAKTINGDVTVDYIGQPSQDASIYSLNGIVSVYLNDQPDLIVSFKSNYGELFTNIENAIPLPYSWVRKDSEKGTMYKIEGRSRFQYGNGSTTLSLETFNGDAFLKKKKNSNY